VPKNNDPTPITYPILRRIFEQFTDDLAKAELTLSRINDDKVTLPLRLASVKLDLVGAGSPTDNFIDILKKLMHRERFEFLKDNADFLVKFDRGDVAWLRAYCHLLSAMLDLYLAMDGQPFFDLFGEEHFEKPKGQAAKKPDAWSLLMSGIKITEPCRLHSFRKHMLMVCSLNRETWRFIRAERDDDHEWLPNPFQKGVFGLSVTNAMIDGWLSAIDELEGLLKGEKVLELQNGTGFNVKTYLEEPPARIVIWNLVNGDMDEKYRTKTTDKNKFDHRVFNRVMALFTDSMSVAYAAWFN
jgi:hypothetical protein